VYLDVEHRLTLDYDAPIRESFIELHLQPKPTLHQTVASFALAVGPPTAVHRYRDFHDNVVHHMSITRLHDHIEVSSRSLVQTHPAAAALATIVEPTDAREQSWELYDYLQLDGPLVPSRRLTAFVRSLDAPKSQALGLHVRQIGDALTSRFHYRKDVTRFDSTTDDFLEGGAGVCQDFAHLMLALLRLRRVPCRYVSGYLHVDPKPGETAQSHAWIEFHSGAHGWIPYDPTHAREIDERYVVVAHGRHYDDVPPNRGIYRGAARETLSAEVRTAVTTRKPVSVLHEEIRHIELPVFREVAAHTARWVSAAAEEAAAQQQQQ
jgi:transglutaminase-like putative cysteine protease